MKLTGSKVEIFQALFLTIFQFQILKSFFPQFTHFSTNYNYNSHVHGKTKCASPLMRTNANLVPRAFSLAWGRGLPRHEAGKRPWEWGWINAYPWGNRWGRRSGDDLPFPSCLLPMCANDSSSEPFIRKCIPPLQVHFDANQTYFKEFCKKLISKQTHKATRKWLITLLKLRLFTIHPKNPEISDGM